MMTQAEPERARGAGRRGVERAGGDHRDPGTVFLIRVILALVFYVFAMGIAQLLPDRVNSTFVSTPILAVLALGVAASIAQKGDAFADFGVTWDGWRRAVVDAVAWSLPVMLAIVALKAALVAFVPQLAGAAVFELGRIEERGLASVLGLAAGYVAFCPVQQFVVRAGVQRPAEMFLSGPHVRRDAVILSTLIFSAMHMHVSLGLALVVMPFALFWAWLFRRHPTLVGVSVSHILIGGFGYFVVGFSALYQ